MRNTRTIMQLMSWNRVVTVENFWDTPREGFAFWDERLIAYKCLWDGDADGYSDWYEIKPIEHKMLPLIEESWSIWKKWESAFHSGATSKETHPVLPEDRPRHEELERVLKPVRSFAHAKFERAKAEFRSTSSEPNHLKVRWFS